MKVQLYTLMSTFLLIKVNLINSEVNVISSCDQLTDDNGASIVPNVNISLHISFGKVSGNKNIVESNECGYTIPRNKSLSPNHSFEGEFPWFTMIYKATFKQISYECSGSLISKNSILTSAACITLGLPVETAEILAVIGKFNFNKWSEKYQFRSIENIIIHPNFNFASLESDLAILKLYKNVVFTDYVRPVCLWNFNPDINSLIGQEGIHPGFDYDDTNYLTEELDFIRMPIVPTNKCILNRSGLTNLKKSYTLFCAGFRSRGSVCKGDDGTGLVFKVEGKWYLRGVDSSSIGEQNEVVCDGNHYAAFVDIAQFVPWLNMNK